MSLKVTSDPLAVSFSLVESAANTYTTAEIGLQLDVLNNEVALVYAIDLDLEEPDAVAAGNTRVTGNISTTAQTAMKGLETSNVLAQARDSIRGAGFVDSGVGFSRGATTSYTGDVPYIGIISTNNFHISVEGTNNVTAKSLSGRVWLARARADASTYAALVQSEVLSA